MSGDPEVVLQVGVTHIPAVHGARQVRAVGVPVENVERIRLAAFEIVADHVGPDEIVSAQRGEHKSKLSCRQDAAAADRLLARRHTPLVDQQGDLAGLREVEHGREKR